MSRQPVPAPARLRLPASLAVALLAAAAVACSKGKDGSDGGSAVTVAISPITSSVAASGAVQFTATVSGSADTAVTWSISEGTGCGSVSAAGLYIAPGAAASSHVVATSAADPSESATATVTVSAPVSVSISPAAAGVEAAGTLQLTAAVTGASDGGVIFTVSEGTGCGSVSATGLYTAPDAAASSHVVATSAADPSKSATATVTVAAPVSVSISPASAKILTSATVALTAAVTRATDTSVSWSATAGTVDAAGNFTAPTTVGPVTVTATSVADPRRSASATVSVVEVPIVTITTAVDQSTIQHDTYSPGTVSIDAQDGVTATLSGLTMQIKGRGNSTWNDPKKPYKLKLDKKASLLGMPADKEWALLSLYEDPALIRNSMAMELSRRLGMPWTPRSQLVELTWNGAYQGVYLLIETVKVATNRVNITEMAATDTTGDAVTGGYLLERDARQDADSDELSFSTSRSEPFVVHDPTADDPSTALAPQKAYIQGYLQALEDALFGGDFTSSTGYPSYLNVDTAIGYYLVNELTKNVDGTYSSFYSSKDRLGKLSMGPVWDFDRSLGNLAYGNYYTCGEPTGWYIRAIEPEGRSQYFIELFLDPAFAAAARARWDAAKAAQLDTLGDYVDQLAAYLAHAQPRDETRWKSASGWPLSSTTYAAAVAQMKQFLADRTTWVDANL